jgi:hypothetical protein
MKEASEIKPSYAPVYAAAMYPSLCKIFHKHGYALAVHGSLARDFDCIAVPWTVGCSTHAAVIAEMMAEYAVQQIGEPEQKPNGRIAYTFSVGFGMCALDLSFTPIGKGTK